MAHPLTAVKTSGWNERSARHLLNRAGFGLPRDETVRLAAMSPEEAVSHFVDFENLPPAFTPPDFLVSVEERKAHYQRVRNLPVEEQQQENSKLRMREIAAVRRLRGWWLQRMAETPRPLEEKLTLFWHGHFPVSAQKVQPSYFNYYLNDTFRKNAAGNFRELTTAVGESPAMLRYLDNAVSEKGKPNENWARELMELFTLGTGNYTEQDIKAGARAFTGWTNDVEGFLYRKYHHDDGMKTFLGRTGEFDGWDVINIIFEQPAAARFIVEKLWSFFAYPDPEPEIVTALASELRASDYALQPVLRTMFTSRAFYSERAIGQRIKSPVEHVLQVAADLRIDKPAYAVMGHLAAQMGQNLFFPPNVKGWDGGKAWINTHTLLLRYNLPNTMLMATQLAALEDDADDSMMMRPKAMGKMVENMIKNAPPEVRRAYGPRIRSAAPEDRPALILEAINELGHDTQWSVEEVFAGIDDMPPEEGIAKLESRYLSAPLTDTQRAQLVRTLAGEESDSAPNRDRMLDTLRLLMSLAEYQLC